MLLSYFATDASTTSAITSTITSSTTTITLVVADAYSLQQCSSKEENTFVQGQAKHLRRTTNVKKKQHQTSNKTFHKHHKGSK